MRSLAVFALIAGLLLAPGSRAEPAAHHPRAGGSLVAGVAIAGPGKALLGAPPREPDRDWVILVRRDEEGP